MANSLLREGPVPVFVHGVIEYVAGVAFIAAPLLLGFESSTATGLAVAVGIVILLVAATTQGPTSLVDAIQVVVHVVLDYVLAVFLIATPFLFDFSDDTPATVWFVALGVAHLLITVGTRFLPVMATPVRK
jgi:hypothetical protein